MGLTRSEIFTEEQNRLAAMAKVLAHPARIAIIQHLIAQQQCVCGDLVSVVGLAQPTISQHLKELKSFGLIQGTIEGTRVCYCLNPSAWEELNRALGLFLGQALSPDNACC